MPFDSANWTRTLQQMQPDSGTGAQRAGMPGMGGGNIPYAPGMTQFAPSAPVTSPSAPQSSPTLPQGAGGPNMAGTPPSPAQGPTQGPQAMPDVQRIMMVSEYLMERLKRQMAMNGGGRRG